MATVLLMNIDVNKDSLVNADVKVTIPNFVKNAIGIKPRNFRVI